MRSLLHYTTLTITTAVLALISCATQTQAVGGGGSLDRAQNPNSYARQYMDGGVAAKNGLSKVEWYGGGRNAFSFARVTYNRRVEFMKCIPKNNEELAFDKLVIARDTLTGINKEYRNYVAYPLIRIEIPALPPHPAGNCYVYRYINGDPLWQVISGKSYAERLVIINQIMPQLLKGFIYLYNAGIKHADLHVGNVIVSKQFFGGLKTTIFDFDIIQELSPNRRLLDINTLSTMGSLGPSSPYACFDFQKAPTEFISLDVNLNMVKDPQNITSDERKAIAGHIIRNSGPAFSQSLTERKLEQVVNAYISLLRVTSISTQGNGCTSLVAALRSMSTPQQSSGNMFTRYFRKTPQQQPTQ